MVSLHADTIYTRYFDFAKASPEDAAAVRAFLDEQHGLQTRLAASLRDDPAYGGQASPENIARNQRLIAALDWLSLEICWGVEKETKIPDVPTAGKSRTELSLCPRKGENLVLRRAYSRSLAFPGGERRGPRRGKASARPIFDAR